jgi:hypothetical protein
MVTLHASPAAFEVQASYTAGGGTGMQNARASGAPAGGVTHLPPIDFSPKVSVQASPAALAWHAS